MKKCPFCGADIEDSARFCLYCMQSLTEKKQVLPSKKTKPQRMIVIAAIAVAVTLIILAFLQSSKQVASGDEYPSEQQSSVSPIDNTVPSDTQSNTEHPHAHSFYIENTDIQYQKVAATCIAPAVYYYSCPCGEAGSETFFFGAPGEHNILTDSGYAASCSQTGLTDGAHCSVCNAVLISQTQLPIINHTYDADQDEGCNVCGFTRVLNCKHTETVKLTAVPPTCTAGGLTEGEKCRHCEEILTTQIPLAPLGHKAVADPAITATCTTDGLTEGWHCTTCDTILAEQIPVAAKGHAEVIDPAVAATCTTTGKTEGKHCSACNVVLVAQTTVAAKGHTGVIDPAVVATCTTTGKTEGKHCSACNTILLTQSTIPANAHNFLLQDVSSKYLASEATCITPATYYYSCTCGAKGDTTFTYGKVTPHTLVTEPGYPAGCVTVGLTDRIYCSVCNDTIEFQSLIPATGHTYTLGALSPTCLDCGNIGTPVISEPMVPCILNDTLRVNSCTYTIHTSSPEEWKIVFCINYTNISSQSTTLHPVGNVYPEEAGYGIGLASYDYSDQLNPNESSDCYLSGWIPNAGTLYTLKLGTG